jgi:hypothetical protein
VWDSIIPWAGSAGVAGTVALLLRIAYRLHLDAVGAQRERASDWKEIALAERARADLREQQLGMVFGRASETV